MYLYKTSQGLPSSEDVIFNNRIDFVFYLRRKVFCWTQLKLEKGFEVLDGQRSRTFTLKLIIVYID